MLLLSDIINTVDPVIEQVVEHVETVADIPTWFVVVMGMGIVFVGLVSLILLITLMGKLLGKASKQEEAQAAVSAPAAASADAIPNRSELVAAVSVALAEELGKDVRAIRILSIKKV